MIDGAKLHDSNSRLSVGRVVVIVTMCVTIAALASYLLDFYKINSSQLELKNLPPLLPAPSPAAQQQILADMGMHPNPPFVLGELIPRGTDAAGLATLLSVAGPPKKEEDVLIYRLGLPLDRPNNLSTTLVIQIAGDPPRVIQRTLEEYPNN